MKKKLTVALMLLLVVGMAAQSEAHRYRRARNDNPGRLIGYALHPLGLAAEFVILRPVHWLVSRDHLDIVFGHAAHINDDGTYFEWTHGDFRPSVAEERSDFRKWRAENNLSQVEARRGMEMYERDSRQHYAPISEGRTVLIEEIRVEEAPAEEPGLVLTDEKIEENEEMQEQSTTTTTETEMTTEEPVVTE